MTRWFLLSPSLLLATMSLGACAKPTHSAFEAEANHGAPALEPVHAEPADRPGATAHDRPKTQTAVTDTRDDAETPSESVHAKKLTNHGPPPEVPECETPPNDVGPSPTPQYEIQGAPEGTTALSRALRARHAKDVPSGETLAEHPGAEVQLRYLATHGEQSIERQRALSLLRHFPSDETRALLKQIVEQSRLHASIRAAALRSLVVVNKAREIDEDTTIEDAKKSDEPRIRKAAEDVPTGASKP